MTLGISNLFISSGKNDLVLIHMILKYKYLYLIAKALNCNASRCIPEGPIDNNSTQTGLFKFIYNIYTR